MASRSSAGFVIVASPSFVLANVMRFSGGAHDLQLRRPLQALVRRCFG
jgi:hypothetical protein